MCQVVAPRDLRACREALGLSQSAFATELGVSPETYRVWDSGRLPPPSEATERAQALVAYRDDREPLALATLAVLIGVHVRTLRNAARDGRLSVTYDTRTTFRSLRARATLVDARAFRRSYFGKRVRKGDRRTPPSWSGIPVDYDLRIRDMRQCLGVSQGEFARLVGAAQKAVVYQWESRKRCPSPVFWQRIERLPTGDPVPNTGVPPHGHFVSGERRAVADGPARQI